MAVLDSMMPFVNARRRKTEVLIFTLYDDARHIGEILEAGARGYVLKSDITGQLLNAIESLAKHKPFFTATVSETLLGSLLTQQRRDGICLSDWERTAKVIRTGGSRQSSGSVARLSRIAERELCADLICRRQQRWFFTHSQWAH